MNTGTFHYFVRLPPEIRRLIWRLCLPYRVAEEEEACFSFDGEECRQACVARRIANLNAQPPTLAFVCTESRQVAMESGHSLELSVGADWIWVQPQRDMLLLNWVRRAYNVWWQTSDLSSPVAMFLLRASDDGMEPSVIAEIIHPFRLEALLLDGHDSAAVSDDPRVLYHGNENIEVSDIAAFADWQKAIGVVMAAVSLHITREVALNCGLFGLLGDAPVQLVDLSDGARLAEFHALFKEHVFEREPAAQALFELFESPRFQTAVESWKLRAEWLILVYLWQRERQENMDLLGSKPGLAWVPELAGQRCIEMSRHVPNEEHPWVKRAREMVPELRPRIMVRYCTNECYMKGRLPEGFSRL
jgi:hypothetical protein